MTTDRLARLPLPLALLLALASCTTTPRTQVMVVVSADESVRSNLTRLTVGVGGGPTAGALADVETYTLDSVDRWPLRVPLVPLNNDATRAFVVTVTANTSAGNVVARGITGFVPGETRMLLLHLGASCADVPCADDETCSAAACRAAYVDPSSLPAYDPDAQGMSSDAGPVEDGGAPDGGRPDAGTPDGGGPDAGEPDGGMPDGGMPDGGMPDAGMPGSTCGNGTIEAGEVCDDGNRSNADSCPDGTGGSCMPSFCGDGFVFTLAEDCDDRNRTDGDGCSRSCEVEPGYDCSTGEPSLCRPVCGDGIRIGDEECDDGNTMTGDGCAPDCTFPSNVIVIDIQGMITTSDHGGLFPGIGVGDTFSGRYVYRMGAADDSTVGDVGRYYFRSPGFGVDVEIEGYRFSADYSSPEFMIEVVNRSTDNYLIRSRNNMATNGQGVERITWQLDDNSGTALSTDALPLTPPDLSRYTQPFGFTIEGTGFAWLIRGVVTSASLRPL